MINYPYNPHFRSRRNPAKCPECGDTGTDSDIGGKCFWCNYRKKLPAPILMERYDFTPLPMYEVPEACDCEVCRSMCKRPCWPTPQDAERLMDLGYGDRLMIDYWDADESLDYTEILVPAFHGLEKDYAPSSMVALARYEEAGCNFLTAGGLCEIHSICKPTEGRLASCKGTPKELHLQVVQTWDSPEGKALVERWKKEYRHNPENPEVIAYHRSPKKLKSIRLNDTHSGYGAFFSSKPHQFKGKYVYQVKLDLTNGLSYVEEPPADIARDISDEIGIDISGLTVGDLVRPTAEESDAPGAHEPGLLRQYMSKETIAEFFLRRGINYFWDDTSGVTADMQYMVFDPESISIIKRRNTFQHPELNRGVWLRRNSAEDLIVAMRGLHPQDPDFTADPTQSEYYNAKKAFRWARFAALRNYRRLSTQGSRHLQKVVDTYISRMQELSHMFPYPEREDLENSLTKLEAGKLELQEPVGREFNEFVSRWLPSLLTNEYVSTDEPTERLTQGGDLGSSVFSEWGPRRPKLPRRKIKITTQAGLRCAYCHDTFVAGEIPHTCTGCRTLRHQACVEEGGVKCPTFGCPKRRRNPMTPDGWVQAFAEIYTSDGIPVWKWELGKLEDIIASEIQTKEQLRELLDNAIDIAVSSGVASPGDKLVITIGNDVEEIDL